MNRPYLIAEMGVNFYDTALALNISPLDAAKLLMQQQKQVLIVQSSNHTKLAQ